MRSQTEILTEAQAAAAEIQQINEQRKQGLIDWRESEPAHAAATARLIAANRLLPWAKRVEPYKGGWFIDTDGRRKFLMPPYPGVDY